MAGSDGSPTVDLVAHPCVDKVAFAGSTEAGRAIGEVCGRLLRPATLELGGKSAAIVLTAVVAFNDLVAIGALRAARRLGVRVPDDCALVGYDGLSVVDLIDPPLTTLHLDKRRLGALAIHQVDRLLAGELPPPVVLTPTLDVRGTT